MRSGTVRARDTGLVRGGTTAAAVVIAALGVTGLAACSSSPQSQVPAVTAQDLREVENDVAALEERIAELEVAPLGPVESTSPSAPSDELGGAENGSGLAGLVSLPGKNVRVQARVSRPATVNEIGSAFRLVDAAGQSVPVVSATPTEALQVGTLVEVVGVTVRVEQRTFEQDFGIAADALFDEPARWFEQNERDVAISADRVQAVQAESDR